MTQAEKLIIEIAKLQDRYDKSTGRNAYTLGAKLRAKKAELTNLTKQDHEIN